MSLSEARGVTAMRRRRTISIKGTKENQDAMRRLMEAMRENIGAVCRARRTPGPCVAGNAPTQPDNICAFCGKVLRRD